MTVAAGLYFWMLANQPRPSVEIGVSSTASYVMSFPGETIAMVSPNEKCLLVMAQDQRRAWLVDRRNGTSWRWSFKLDVKWPRWCQ